MDHRQFLKGIDIFSPLTEQELNSFAAVVREESFPEGAVVFAENSPGSNMYVVREGAIDIGKREETRGEILKVARLGPGEVLGELSIFDEKPRSAGALAAGSGNTLLLSIGKADLDRLMSQNPALAIKFLRTILQKVISRLRQADDLLLILAKMNVILDRVRR